jgi:hypothetical protein
MRVKKYRVKKYRVPAFVVVASLVASAGSALAQARSIEGVWAVSITLRNCTTTAPLGHSSRGLFTFHEGGTLTESPANPGFAAGQRSIGHGVWTSTGPTTYTSRIVAAILFDTPPAPPTSPGFLAGWQVGSQAVTLTDADHFVSTGHVQFYDVNRQLYRTVCPSGTAERFK